jgi:transposase
MCENSIGAVQAASRSWKRRSAHVSAPRREHDEATSADETARRFGVPHAFDRAVPLIEEQLRPFRDDFERLCTMPGVSFVLAAVLLAEIGPDMHRFPTAGHLVSWAGLCAGLNETGGKSRPSRIRKGAPWLESVLVQAAWSAVRTKGSYFRGLYYRIKTRRGPQKAIRALPSARQGQAHPPAPVLSPRAVREREEPGHLWDAVTCPLSEQIHRGCRICPLM